MSFGCLPVCAARVGLWSTWWITFIRVGTSRGLRSNGEISWCSEPCANQRCRSRGCGGGYAEDTMGPGRCGSPPGSHHFLQRRLRRRERTAPVLSRRIPQFLELSRGAAARHHSCHRDARRPHPQPGAGTQERYKNDCEVRFDHIAHRRALLGSHGWANDVHPASGNHPDRRRVVPLHPQAAPVSRSARVCHDDKQGTGSDDGSCWRLLA